VGTLGYDQLLVALKMTSFSQLVLLAEKNRWIYNQAVSDDVEGIRVEYPGRDKMDDNLLSGYFQSVAGIAAALEPHDHVRAAG
jgi:hypothetical protein